MSEEAITWRSKRQECVGLSTNEAEYMALASAAQESVWFRMLPTEHESPLKGPNILFEDH